MTGLTRGMWRIQSYILPRQLWCWKGKSIWHCDTVMSDRVTLMAFLHCDSRKARLGESACCPSFPSWSQADGIGGFLLSFSCVTLSAPPVKPGHTEAVAEETAKLCIRIRSNSRTLESSYPPACSTMISHPRVCIIYWPVFFWCCIVGETHTWERCVCNLVSLRLPPLPWETVSSSVWEEIFIPPSW